jgi:hypothetical protein
MKQRLLLFTLLVPAILFSSRKIAAQTGSWKLKGNQLTGIETFGSVNHFDLKIITDSVERLTIKTSSGYLGVGTNAPENTLHVFKGSAGVVSGHSNAPLVVENSTNCYINLLAPNVSESAVLFGNPTSAASGGIVYNNPSASNGFQFRTNGNAVQMTLTNAGNVGIGIQSPATKLQVVGGIDLSAGGNGYIVAGSATSKNLAIDENEIRARNNANASDLLLNSNGGNVIMNNTATKLGIGISAPVADLHVFHNGGSQTNGFRLQNQNKPKPSLELLYAKRGKFRIVGRY